MSGLKTNLAVGIAELLDELKIGIYSTSSAHDPEASLPLIKIARVPDEPGRLITLTTYPVSDDTGVPNSVVMLQVRCRWDSRDPRPADDLDDAIFQALQQFSGVLSTGVRVGYCRRISGAPLGEDERERRSVSSNYSVSVYWPTGNRH